MLKQFDAAPVSLYAGKFMCLLGMLSILFASNCSANALPDDWNHAYQYENVSGHGYVAIYLSASGNALGSANASLVVRGQQPLYCPPPKLALGLHNYVDIFERELHRIRMTITKDHRITIEDVLLSGLQMTFPCAQR